MQRLQLQLNAQNTLPDVLSVGHCVRQVHGVEALTMKLNLPVQTAEINFMNIIHIYNW